jgi:hypothetical protein
MSGAGAKAWPLDSWCGRSGRGSEARLRFFAFFSRDLRTRSGRSGTGSEEHEDPGTLAALSLPIIALATQDPEVVPSPLPEDSSKGDLYKKLFTVLSIVFAIGLFVALPQLFAYGASWLFNLGLNVREPLFQVLTGSAKLVIVIGYMLVIRRLPEIYRVFQYHGAEHKSIYAYESGEELSVENARTKTTLHPRAAPPSW